MTMTKRIWARLSHCGVVPRAVVSSTAAGSSSSASASSVAPISCDRQWFHCFRNAADVLIVDNYPLRGTYAKKARTSINETHACTVRAVQAMSNRAVWYMPPMYPGSDWSLKPDVPVEAMMFGPDPAHNSRAYDAEVFTGAESRSNPWLLTPPSSRRSQP